MIELQIPQAGEETKQAKDLVFSALSEKKQLSLIELFNLIKNKYNLNVTYHAIKKAADLLVSKNVLEKKDKFYQINKNWLIDVKHTVDKLLTNVENKEPLHLFHSSIANEQYATYTFTNLIDCDNFWDDLLINLANNIEDKEEKIFLVRTHYNWWYLINYGQETKLHSTLLKKGFDTNFLIIGENHLNKWAKEIYLDIGVKSKIIVDEHSEKNLTLNILGNTIIQTYYPNEILEKLRLIYRNYKKTQDIPLKLLTELANIPCEIKLNVFKNKEIAQSLRERYLKKFD